MSTKFIITVDTEEEGLWGGRYPATGNTVENIGGIPRFQELCDRYQVRPTYLVTAPVVESDDAVRILREIQDDGRCEIGTHLHPWCTPPLSDVPTTGRTSYLCNLSENLQRAKIEWLTDRIEERFGQRPVSFRAGRYGMDHVGIKILGELGYRVDSSVIPFTNYASQGGPDFRGAQTNPYWAGGDEILVPQAGSDILEVPVTVGFSRPDFERAQALQEFANRPALKPLRLEGIMDRLGIARRIKLSPEQATAERLRQLVDACVARQAETLVLMFHSSSLLPGMSPYVKSAGALDQFLACVECIVTHCVQTLEIDAATLTEVADGGEAYTGNLSFRPTAKT